MTDQPWNRQPAAPSRIILPVDTIILEIDNRRQPAVVNMRPSRELPIPFVINVFSNLISQLSAQLGQAMQQGIPLAPRPGAEPETEPPKTLNNGGA